MKKKTSARVLLVIFTIIVVAGVIFLTAAWLGVLPINNTDTSAASDITGTSDEGSGGADVTGSAGTSTENTGAAGTSATSSEYSEDTIGADTGIIFIGDSRFVGMNEAVGIDSMANRFVVAETGQGYFWFKNTGLYSALSIEQSNPQVSSWIYVICLGINDLNHEQRYEELYDQLIMSGSSYTVSDKETTIVLVSVGPVGDYPDITNDQVDEFNIALKTYCSINGIKYIDYNTTLTEQGYTTIDGLHYNNDTYRQIYQIIMTGLTS